MKGIPAPLSKDEIRFWRVDPYRFKDTWHTEEGSYRVGGRWSSGGLCFP